MTVKLKTFEQFGLSTLHYVFTKALKWYPVFLEPEKHGYKSNILLIHLKKLQNSEWISFVLMFDMKNLIRNHLF